MGLVTLARQATGPPAAIDLGALVLGVAGLAALAKKAIDFLRLTVEALRARTPAAVSSVVTQLTAWAGGVVAVFLYGASQFGDSVHFGPNLTPAVMDGPTKLLAGLALGSTASLVTDFLQARDNTDSQTKPPLLR